MESTDSDTRGATLAAVTPAEDDHAGLPQPQQQPQPNNSSNNNSNLAPFNPSSETAQLQSIEMMDLHPDDVLFDLGCGDARLLIRVVSEMLGVRCVGVEMDPLFVKRAKQRVMADLSTTERQQRIDIRCQDVTAILSSPETKDPTVDKDPDNCATTTTTASLSSANDTKPLSDITIDDATVIYLYLLPRGLRQIKPMLDELVARHRRRMQKGESKGRLRVVAYTFQVPGWEPVRVDTSTKSGVPIYLYEFSS